MKLQSFALYLLFHCISIVVATSESVDCVNTPYGRSCTLPSAPERTALIDNRLFIGVVDELLSFQLGDLQLSDRVNLSSSQQRHDKCVEGGNALDDCRNFLRVIQPLPESAVAVHGANYRILVCGTNSHFPKCTLHNLADLSDWVNMTLPEQNDRGFVPYSNSRPNVGVLASNNRFFSGTFFFEYQTSRTIGMAPNPLQGDSTFTVETPKSDRLWLNQPDFVSAYEIGDQIYFFVTERALEVGRTVVYSRALRVCKDDEGLTQPSQSADIFSTFHKARMQCTYSGERTSIPYEYDNLKATFLLNSNNEHILYGAFSSPINGPEGAAICKFTFDETIAGSLTHVFDDGKYYFQDENDEWVDKNAGAFSCPGTNRTSEHVRDYQLVLNPATPLEPQPLHMISGNEFTQIVVDVVNYNGGEQEILYYSLTNGEIRQYVISGGEKYEHIIYDTEKTVHNLVLHKDADSETRYIYATTDDNVMSIPLGDCTRYTGCFECMDSKDPYCGWDQDRCVNKFNLTTSIIESFSSTEESIIATCGERPTVSPMEPPISPTCSVGYTTSSSSEGTLVDPSTDTPQATEVEVPVQCTPSGSNPEQTTTPKNTPNPTVVGNVGGIEDSEGSGSIPIPELIGASVGGVIVGIPVGLIICAFFYATFIRKRKEPKPNRSTVSLDNSPATVVAVNNQLEMNAHKKEQSLQRNQNHYIDAPVPKVVPQTPERKNINEYEAEEGEDDVLTDLPPSNAFGGPPNGITVGHTRAEYGPVTTGNPRILHRPIYSAQRSRTESARRLMSSVSSDPSDSPGNSPLESPA